MNIYQVQIGEEDFYTATLDGVKELVRSEPAQFRAAVQVHLLDIPVTKQNVLGLLTNNWTSKTVRSWHGTARGGLKLVEVK